LVNKSIQQFPKRVLIVGGVAGGASCAARLRRVSEKAEIIIFERGQHVSFASCGLPYFVGGVIQEEKNLLVATPELFKERFNIEVKLHNDVIEIDRQNQEISVNNLDSGIISHEHYDSLVLSTGSTAIRPAIPGIDLPGIFTLRTIQDSLRIKNWMVEKKVKKAVVVGGGFIGLETVENLVSIGVSVTIVEQLPQVMPTLDPEMAIKIQDHLVMKKVDLHLGSGVIGFYPSKDNRILVRTLSGIDHDCDMVLLATGVRPETFLARQSGLEIGKLGGIRVDEQMRTTDKNIWAVGDAVEVRNYISKEWSLIPLAGPASRQGRIAADVISGRKASFRGVQGTLVCKIFEMTAAATGLSEKYLIEIGSKLPYQKVYLHPANHAGYYPGSKTITFKLIFSPEDGKILGAQAVGEEGCERRIDVISMAIQKGATVYDLEEAEMCYAPQFGSAKDPINIAGMIAANVLRNDSPVTHWDQIQNSGYYILDVREPSEFNSGHYEGAINIPLNSLRSKLGDLPKDREIRVYCAAGLRSYYATRILKQNGFSVKNISGGMATYRAQKLVKNI
jgi:NADPH-dependent 2,4-dienoyl-CoA reductase/sulfur reductase-like enzyme/rhodanese-related sulfurtransferase